MKQIWNSFSPWLAAFEARGKDTRDCVNFKSISGCRSPRTIKPTFDVGLAVVGRTVGFWVYRAERAVFQDESDAL